MLPIYVTALLGSLEQRVARQVAWAWVRGQTVAGRFR